MGSGEECPDVYFAAAKRLRAVPEDIAVYEDALYAVQTAKAAGFYVVGVYNDSADKDWEKLTALADKTIRRF